MPTKLEEAFELLHLNHGARLADAKRAYRQFAKAGHPDRQLTEEGRARAEEYLKKVNAIYEMLKKHFKDVHSTNIECYCAQPVKIVAEPTKPASFKTPDEVAAANKFYSYQTEMATTRFSDSVVGRTVEQNLKDEAAKKKKPKTARRETVLDKERRDKQAAEKQMREAARNIFLDKIRSTQMGSS